MAKCLVVGWAAMLPLAVMAAPVPEISRPAGSAQATGTVHTLRQIPEACTRLEGVFTGQAASPYAFNVVRTSAQCQPRARMLNVANANPSEAAGWKLNDVITVPSAQCSGLLARVEVWRKPGAPAPARDGQGQSRIYLQDAKAQAAAGQIAAVPMFAAKWELIGKPCQ